MRKNRQIGIICLSIICGAALITGSANSKDTPDLSTSRYIQLADSADYFIKKKNWSEAERYTLAALRDRPADKLNYLLWSNLGQIRTNMEDYEGAFQAYDIAEGLAPGASAIYINRGSTYMRAGKPDMALSDFSSALNIDSLLEWPRTIRAMLLLNDHKIDAAVSDFEFIIRHFPANAEAPMGLGRIEAIKGNGNKANDYFEEALKIRQNEETWFYKVLNLSETERIPEAEEDIRKALKRFPRSGNLYILRAWLHKLKFQNEEAEAAKKLAVEYNADPEIIKRFFPPFTKK